MSWLDLADVRWSPGVRRYKSGPIADSIFVIVFFVAVFAAEIAIVHFAGPEPPLVQDGQTILLPIT
jgi:hypothetical protein